MLTSRYLTSVKNLPAIMAKIVEGTAPKKFNTAHLKGIGFKSSNDQGVLALLKDLGFLGDDGTPIQRYHAYRDASRSSAVLGEALREAYEELFHINAKPGDGDRGAIKGKFKSVHNVSDGVAQKMTTTFYALLKLADLDAELRQASEPNDPSLVGDPVEGKGSELLEDRKVQLPTTVSLRYNVEIHLPASKDIEVYNSIFKSLKEHLLDD